MLYVLAESFFQRNAVDHAPWLIYETDDTVRRDYVYGLVDHVGHAENIYVSLIYIVKIWIVHF